MKLTSNPIDPIDYLVIGHITQDRIPGGVRLGGTAAFSALTARALGLRVGIVTACAEGCCAAELEGIPMAGVQADCTTTFENVQTPQGRVQTLHCQAPRLFLSHVPETWRNTPIVHFGPVAQEIDPNMVRGFPNSLVALTPQGWLRGWDAQGRVSFSEWPESSFVLQHADVAIISVEDVRSDESYIEEMASSIRILAVTEGSCGSRLYWNGDLRRFQAPKTEEVDPTGAGDIYAASFFYRLHTTHDPWEAARFATRLAARSVTRVGLLGIPTAEEIESALIEVIEN